MNYDAGARAWAYGVAFVFVTAVLGKACEARPTDGFPLSNYPMFSHKRTRAEATIAHVIGISSRGEHRPIPPPVVANDEVMQAAATIARTVRKGRRHALELCERVARAVARDPALDDIVELQVRSDRYHAVAYFSGARRPTKTVVHAACRVHGDAR